MKPDQLRNLHESTMEELKAFLHNTQEELFSLKFKKKAQPVQDPLKIRYLRRDIARARTIIHEKESGRNSSK